MKERVILHADLDAFYASVEMRRRPELRLLPMWVGGGTRGVVLSANYIARSFGVSGGMPSSQARRLCPNGVAVRPNYGDYSSASELVKELFESVSPWVEMASIDEAYLDISGCMQLFASEVEVGEHLRRIIMQKAGLPCSVGIGPNRFVAKMAANAAKPNGLRYVPEDQVVAFLHPKSVSDLFGVGPSTAAGLQRLGINTVGQLAAVSKDTLQRAFGKKMGVGLLDLAWGKSGSRVQLGFGMRGSEISEHSIGCQETFPVDTDDQETISAELLRVSAKVASRMRKQHQLGRVVTLNLRFSNFNELSRSHALRSYTDITGEIHQTAMAIYQKLNLIRPCIRRVGVRMSGLSNREETYLQPTLDAPECGWREAEKAADKVVARFGSQVLTRAGLIRR